MVNLLLHSKYLCYYCEIENKTIANFIKFEKVIIFGKDLEIFKS